MFRISFALRLKFFCLFFVAITLPFNALAQTTTVTSFTATPTNSTVGTSLSLSATVGGATNSTVSPAGSITFLDGAAILGSSTLASSAIASPKVAQLSSAIDSTAIGTLLFADFDGDGKTDALSYSTNAFQVLINKGGGSYSPLAVQKYTLSQPVFFDVNRDGKLDIVSLGPTALSVFRGDGTGVFSTPATLSGVSPRPTPSGVLGTNSFSALAAVDLTGSHLTNILVGEHIFTTVGAQNESGVVSTYRNNGDGTFTYLSSVTIVIGDSEYPRNVTHIQTADLNADGRPDLLATGDNRNGYTGFPLVVALGIGDGTFAGPSSTITSSGVCGPYCGLSVVTGDFAHRGKLDIAFTAPVPISISDNLAIYPGNGDGTFGTPYVRGTVNGATLGASNGYFPSIVATDLDGDGNLDLIDSFGYAYLARATSPSRQQRT